jgi:hypothetical protein
MEDSTQAAMETPVKKVAKRAVVDGAIVRIRMHNFVYVAGRWCYPGWPWCNLL